MAFFAYTLALLIVYELHDLSQTRPRSTKSITAFYILSVYLYGRWISNDVNCGFRLLRSVVSNHNTTQDVWVCSGQQPALCCVSCLSFPGAGIFAIVLQILWMIETVINNESAHAWPCITEGSSASGLTQQSKTGSPLVIHTQPFYNCVPLRVNSLLLTPTTKQGSHEIDP